MASAVEDEYSARLAQQVTHEQAEQNQRIAEGSRAVAQGSLLLVEHDAKARRELVQLQQDLRQDQTDIGKQRDSLEADRKAIAGQRVQESQLSALCIGLVLLLVCLAPLFLAGMSLLGLWRAPTQEEERGVLVEEMSLWLEQEMPQAPTFRAPPDRTIGLPEGGPASQPRADSYNPLTPFGTTMSHIVQIKTQVRDAEAVRAACRGLGLPDPVHGKAKLFSAVTTGLAFTRK